MRRPLSKRVRFAILERDGFTCQYCGASAPSVILHVDHKTPVCRGGENRDDNLITACIDCNLGKAGKEPLFRIDSQREYALAGVYYDLAYQRFGEDIGARAFGMILDMCLSECEPDSLLFAFAADSWETCKAQLNAACGYSQEAA